jgi:hypothetical protein
MAQRDFRAKMSPAEFAAIACDDDYPLDEYYAKLVDGNDRFRAVYQEFPRGYEDINLIGQLSPGQQLLILLGVLDGQICNGGITQFFWNYPEYLFEVHDAIERLGDTAVLSNYERALEALVGKKERWLELRQECYGNKDGPSWESFRQTYDLLDLNWFDQAYFDKRGYNEKNEWVRMKRGLQHGFLHRLAAYIRSHRSEFIEE